MPTTGLHFASSSLSAHRPSHPDNQRVFLNTGHLDLSEVSWVSLYSDSEMTQTKMIDFKKKLSIQNKYFPEL